MKTHTLKVNLKAIISILLSVGIGVLFGYLVFSRDTGDRRTLAVEGQATISHAPNEHTFNPRYEVNAESNQAALRQLNEKVNPIIDKLQDLGVDESKIESDISSQEAYCYRDCDSEQDEYTAYAYLSIKLSDAELAEEVMNYLLNTDVSGSVSPNSTFSEEKKNELKVEARKLAVENARLQADQLANELGVSVKSVVTVEELTGFDRYPIFYDTIESGAAESSIESTPVQPTKLLVGEQDFTFTIKVVFEIG